MLNETIYDKDGANYAIEQRISYHYSTDVLTHTKEDVFTHTKPVVFPNPVQNTFYVSLPPSMMNQSVQLNIFQLSGQLVKSNTVSQDQSIDITQLKPGLYLYQIKSKDKTWTGKLLKI
jgi:hypothetical protein